MKYIEWVGVRRFSLRDKKQRDIWSEASEGERPKMGGGGCVVSLRVFVGFIRRLGRV